MNPKGSVLTFTVWVVAPLMMLVFAGLAAAAEIEGKVTAIAGETLTITLESNLVPNVGDKVEISFSTPDGDKIPVGEWRVTGVTGNTVTAEVVKAEGEANIDMTAVVHSAAPRTASTVRSTSGRAGREGRTSGPSMMKVSGLPEALSPVLVPERVLPVPVPRRPAEPGLYETIRTTEARESPGPGGRVIDQIPAGTRLTVTGSLGNWLVVQPKTGNIIVYVERDKVMRLAEREQRPQANAGVPESRWPEIENQIAQAIIRSGIQGIQVSFIGDTAYLKGTLKTERDRERAEMAARRFPEVRHVTNWIVVDKSWSLFGG